MKENLCNQKEGHQITAPCMKLLETGHTKDVLVINLIVPLE